MKRRPVKTINFLMATGNGTRSPSVTKLKQSNRFGEKFDNCNTVGGA